MHFIPSRGINHYNEDGYKFTAEASENGAAYDV